MAKENEEPSTPVEVDKNPSVFVIEQYKQLNEHRRQVNSFSWQVPTIAFAALLFALSLDSTTTDRWKNAPFIPAIGFSVICLFVVVLLLSHYRSKLTRQWLDELIGEMEKRHGYKPSQYGVPFGAGWNRLQRFSSSTALTIFLCLITLLTFSISIYFWVRWLTF